jgi:LacI family transcriptional regulator
MKNVTSFDVARLAGVSQPTVSRALRNLPGTSPATRAKVTAAAAELSYIVSDSARILSTTRTRRVAVVSEELTNPYYPELVEPIRRHLAERDLRAVVVTDTETASITLDVLADGSYDGVILTTTSRRSTLPRDLTERAIPHVLVNRVLDEPESHSCTVDNVAGMIAVAKLLSSEGHVDVGAVHGPVETSTGRERAEALQNALRDRGIRLRRSSTARARFGHDSGLSAARELLQTSERPTAIVCGNDVIAMGVLSAARLLGLEVPRELTVIGFDDIPMASWPLVGLTTVRCDLDSLASAGVDMLVSEIEEPGRAPRVVRIPVELMTRSTHAKPRDRS